MSEQNKQQGLQVEIKPEAASGVYANLALIAHSHSEFIIDFAQMLPGLPKAVVASRAILAPEHAKRLLFALNDNIRKYEEEFGQIKLPEQQSRTATPFTTPQGEA